MGFLAGLITTAAVKAIARAVHFYRQHAPAEEDPRTPRDVEPYAVFEGRITLNQLCAAGLTGEWEMGEYDPETGMRELKEPKEKQKEEPTRLTTFMDDEEGKQQLTVRWEKGRGKLRLSKARKDELWRVEFYKVADVQETAAPTVAGAAQEGFSPFGGIPGGGVS